MPYVTVPTQSTPHAEHTSAPRFVLNPSYWPVIDYKNVMNVQWVGRSTIANITRALTDDRTAMTELKKSVMNPQSAGVAPGWQSVPEALIPWLPNGLRHLLKG